MIPSQSSRMAPAMNVTAGGIGDKIRGASHRHGHKAGDVQEIIIPPEKAGGWRVEAEFVEAIRTGSPIQFTDFATGVAYMEFTEAVALSAQREESVELPLDE